MYVRFACRWAAASAAALLPLLPGPPHSCWLVAVAAAAEAARRRGVCAAPTSVPRGVCIALPVPLRLKCSVLSLLGVIG